MRKEKLEDVSTGSLRAAGALNGIHIGQHFRTGDVTYEEVSPGDIFGLKKS